MVLPEPLGPYNNTISPECIYILNVKVLYILLGYEYYTFLNTIDGGGVVCFSYNSIHY